MKTGIAFVAAAVFAAVGLGADKPLAWPQFRGPGGSGVADGQRPPVAFAPGKNVKWKVPIPGGLSSPVVAGDKLVVTAFDGGKLYTIAYSRADGKEAWRAEAQAKQIEGYYKTEGSPAAPTPVTDGERVVSYFGSCGLFCYDLSGKELWKFEMSLAAIPLNFGSGVSPIHKDGAMYDHACIRIGVIPIAIGNASDQVFGLMSGQVANLDGIARYLRYLPPVCTDHPQVGVRRRR
jgi:outer membrane protein assembly factor BamB